MANPRKWHDAEFVALLSWLDFCVQFERDFKSTIMTELKKATKESTDEIYPLTEQQVRDKLYSLLRRNGTKYNLAELHVMGTACITTLSSDFRKRISDSVCHYEELYLGKKRQRSGTQDYVQEKDILSQKQKLDLAQALSQSTPEKPTSSRKKLDFEDSQKKISETDEGEARGTANPRTQTGEHPTRKEGGPPEMFKNIRSNSQITHTLQTQLKRKDAEIENIRERWRQEADELQEANSNFKEREKELQAEILHLKQAREERERAGKGPLEHELLMKNREIWRLSARIGKMEKLMSFTQPNVFHSNLLEKSVADELIEKIESQLEPILYGHDMSRPLLIPRIVENSDLSALIQSVFNGAIANGEEERHLWKQLPKFTSDVWIRWFSMAAIRDWVFTTDFPNFAPRDLRLMRAYRYAVLNQGKLVAAQILKVRMN